MTPTTPTNNDVLTVVKLLADGSKDLEFTATATNLPAETVRQIAQSHGYPHADKMRKSVEVLTSKLDTQAQQLPASTLGHPRDRAAQRAGASLAQQSTGSRPAPAAAAPRPQPVAPAPRQFDPTAALLLRGKESDKARTRQLAEKIEDQLVDLRDRIQAEDKARREQEVARARREQEKAAAEEARTKAAEEVRKAEEALKAARAKLRKYKNTPGGNGRATVHRVTGATQETRTAGGKASASRHNYDTVAVRAWANANGIECPQKGRFLPKAVVEAYDAAHASEAAS